MDVLSSGLALFSFYLTVMIGLFVHFVARRKIDFLFVAFLGQLVYFSPGFYGYVLNLYDFNTEPYVPIADGTYWVFTVALAFSLLVSVLYRPTHLVTLKLSTTKLLDNVLMFFLIFSFLGANYFGGQDLYNADKNISLGAQGYWMLFFSNTAQICFVAWMFQKKLFGTLLALLSMLFMLWIGDRSSFTIASVGLLTFIGSRQSFFNLFRLKFLVSAPILLLFVLIYKRVAFAVKLGDWDLLASQLLSGDIVRQAVLFSEPFGTQALLNEIVVRDYTISASKLLWLPLLPIPLLLNSLGVSSADIIFNAQNDLLGGLDFGLAGNIHGQFYAMFGYAGVAIYSLLQNGMLAWLQHFLLKRKVSVARSFYAIPIVLLGSLLSFYATRNDVVYLTNLSTRYFLTATIIYTSYLLSSYLLNISRKNRAAVPKSAGFPWKR